MANTAYGELNPTEVIQQDPRACLSACFLAIAGPESGLSEADITQMLVKDGLHESGMGTGLYPARHLDSSLNKMGLTASAVYEARVAGPNEEQKVAERLARVEKAIKNGQKVVLAFPKRRAGQNPLMHYCVVTGFKETPGGDGVIIMDPSEIDGGMQHPTWQELTEYVTPEEGIPVMAWGISRTNEVQPADSDRKIVHHGLPGLSLLMKPMWREEETGKAIPPGTSHPVSVAMPTADIARQYAEQDAIVLSRDGEHPLGYPRFIIPPVIKELSREVLGVPGNLPFPSRSAAEAAAHMENTYGSGTAVIEAYDLFWLDGTKQSTNAWQHTGLGISSRQAEAVLEGRPNNDVARRDEAEAVIKEVIETYTGAKPEDIYLFPTGMAAVYWLNQALIKMSGGSSGVQFGFPYTDTYDQRKLGPERNVSKNLLDFRDGDYERLNNIFLGGVSLRGIMTEYPSNPLLWTPDIGRLDQIVGDKTPLIIDDTIGTMFNLDDDKLPASVAARFTSLTKFFSSAGDVMGGSVILRPESPHYERLKSVLGELYEDTLWYEDAEVLACNSKLFSTIMPVINRNAEGLAQRLDADWTGQGRPLEAVYHPALVTKESYDEVRKDDGGYGGLLSLRFKDPDTAFRFFDELRVTKGPSLGTYYTLGCLYTLLAHKPVESVKQFGVVPDLVRLSVGIENVDDLQSRFEEALKAAK